MMLASRGAVADIPRLRAAGYLFDLKVDGIRCVATVGDETVELRSRTGVAITGQYPEVVALLTAAFPSGRVTLDGEITVIGKDGFPDFRLTQKRHAQQRRAAQWSQTLPVVFLIFDVLELNGIDLRLTAYSRRRDMLDRTVAQHEGLRATPVSPDGEALWEQVCAHNLEGMIAKKPDAPYRSGRSADWIKIKRTSTVTCLVGGFDPGEGARASTFGALHLYLLDEHNDLVQVGKVGGGFSDADLRKVTQLLLHPPLVVEVEYLDFNSGQLRQPVFQRIRLDADPGTCTLDQLL